jgi:hypothetical protein
LGIRFEEATLEMNLLKAIVLVSLLLFVCGKSCAQENGELLEHRYLVSVGAGYSFQYYNYVLQPSQTGTPLRLDQSIEGVPFLYHFRFNYLIDDKNEIRVLYSPFIRNGDFTPNSIVNFDNKLFSPNEKIESRFVFNLYMIGYVWKGFKKIEGLRAGLTMVVRQGGVHLVSASNSKKNTEIIAVPLFYVGYQKKITTKLLTETDVDFFALPIGYVYEGSVSMYYQLTELFRMGVQYRALGGYVNISNVENRLRTQSLGLSLSYKF